MAFVVDCVTVVEVCSIMVEDAKELPLLFVASNTLLENEDFFQALSTKSSNLSMLHVARSLGMNS